MSRSSRIPGFYNLSVAERRAAIAALPRDRDALDRLAAGPLLDEATADHMIENVIGLHALPLGLGLNLVVNGRDFLVPMSVEEPSIVAAVSNAARMARAGGGFFADADEPIMIGQVQLTRLGDPLAAKARIEAHAGEILALADAAQPGLVARGGGARGLEVRVLTLPEAGRGGMIVVHLHIDCRDAMGANLVNTIAEATADELARLCGGRVGLRILSNLADRRRARARCEIPASALVDDPESAAEVARAIVDASRFAVDPYRAATHNKGILNGVDAAALACGNDWRGIEAGAHAYAARDGAYRPLSTWRLLIDGSARDPDRDDTIEEAPDRVTLVGRVELPMAVGIVGGATRAHRGARLALDLIDAASATELAMVFASVGLAANLAALRALATEGIQRGHMGLHARTVAVAAGAPDALVEAVAAELRRLGDIRPERAAEVLARLRSRQTPAVDVHSTAHVAPPHDRDEEGPDR